MNGISSVTDSPRPGQAYPVVTPEAIAAVEDILKENRHVTVNEIAAHLDMSHGSAHHIVRDVMQFIYIFEVFAWLTLVAIYWFIPYILSLIWWWKESCFVECCFWSLQKRPASWSSGQSLTTNHEVPGSIPGSTVGIFPEGEDSRGDHGMGRLV